MFDKLVLIFTVLVFSNVSFGKNCSAKVEAQLMQEAQRLFNGPKEESPLYENHAGAERYLKLILFPGEQSFAEYFSKNGFEMRVFFIKNTDGTYQELVTDLNVKSVVACDKENQSLKVSWNGSYPKVYFTTFCTQDPSVFAPSYIEYYKNGAHIVGEEWLSDGFPATCDGSTHVENLIYTPK